MSNRKKVKNLSNFFKFISIIIYFSKNLRMILLIELM